QKSSDMKSTYHIYAYTDDKDLSKKFEKDHDMRLFIKRKKKMTKPEYNKFRQDTSYAELEFGKVDDKHELLMPKHELDQISDFDWRIRAELSELAHFPYQIFKPKYIKALDLLLYCTIYQCSWGKDPDYYVYNYDGYGVTAEGYGNRISDSVDKLLAYYYEFALVLRKD
ncbi:MAG: hypothetical protein K2O54_01080, partial [Prevotella sp.]|nr:hypothetical protein [Prevotella sp.]